jgi:hypothetical protein
VADDAQVADIPGSAPEAPPSVPPPTLLAEPEPAGDWKEQLPTELREHHSLQNISDVGTLAKTMIHAQSMVGAEKIAVPGKWATDDDWTDVYNKLGRPDDATGYEFDFGDADTDTEFVDGFRSVAHEVGLSDRQAQKLAGWYMDTMAQNSPEAMETDVEAAKAETEAALRKEFGRAFDDRLALGDRMLGEFAADGLMDVKTLDGLPLVNNEAFIKTIISAAHYISESVAEDRLVGEKGGGGMTPGEADKEIQNLMREDSPYWDARHPMHDSTVQQVLKLQEQKHPPENDA